MENPMKYVFGIDVTNDINNSEMDGQTFHNRSVDYEMKETLQKCNDIHTILTKQKEPPAWMDIIRWFAFAAGCFILCIIIKIISEIGLKKAYSKAPMMFAIAASLLLLSFVFYIMGLVKMKRDMDTDNYDIYHVENMMKGVKNRIDIPQNAELIEVMKFYYKIKNEKMKFVKQEGKRYKNCQMYVYVRNENLYLTDLLDEWIIPLYCFTKINRSNNAYHSIGIEWFNNCYYLLLNPYEADKISSLDGINTTILHNERNI